MYQYSNDFYERKINKRNHLIKRVRQNYVRDDISCGFKCCNEEIFEDFIVYVIPTKEVIEKYKSLLKSEFCKSIICQSVFLNLSLSDQKKVNNSFKHIFFYDNFFIETVNKGLEGVLKFYEKHIPNKKFDILNLENIKEYPKYFNFNKHIIDLCEDVYVKEETKFESYYDNLEELYNCGKIYKAQMMTDTFNWRNGTVIINSCKVRILGIEHMNRAVNGDEVYVEMIKIECFDFISEAEDEDEVKKHKLINNIVKVRSNADIDLFKNKNNASENENNKTTNSNQNNLLNILEPKEMFFGKVVGIYKRNKTSLVGTIINNTVNGEGTQNVLVLPIDKKYPPVMIRTSQIEELLNKRLWIELELWEQDSKYPSGHYFKKLNKIGDIEGEIECILISNGITYFKDKWIDLFVKSTNFYDVETCKMLKNEISEFFNLNDIYSEVKNGIRKDFRNLKIISIDPKGCTDVDDALHINFLENGTFQVGVHIADVSHYVKLGSMLDKIASERGTTVYLPDRRIDMLPEFLSAGLCSLLEDQDRGSFSVIWELTSTGEIISTEFCKSLIHSHKAFSYDEALEILNSKTEVKYKKELETLFKISSNLRNRRMENGALDLSSEKVELKIKNYC
ncbi:exosome complex exonuclease exoribonuclease [Vairimorpha apis BRL 01]|uniref:Exosome complex exonuclease exoribonuclease n=1 Tax=Vairimorpha apis BRL 01 TaxID=1037528 RepID=T0L4L6_9MICR|nr:exosome complex exonuclease exoribonuclease [Vairimorpha apis BRL 01]